jgi:hypothetical protein
MNNRLPPKFWRWLVLGSGGKPGVSRIFDGWIILHVCVATGMCYLMPIKMEEAADSVLTPLAGLLIGLAFAWGANAQALLQCDEIEEIAERSPGGLVDYVYIYLLAVLIILITIVLWGFAGLGIYDKVWPTAGTSNYRVVEFVLFLMSSITIRTSWHVVLGSQMMLVIRWAIRRKKNQ